jgi:hypothetical protein
MLFFEEMELGLVGQTFHFLNVFVILNEIFILELIKRNRIRFLHGATVPKSLIEPKGYKRTELETTLP